MCGWACLELFVCAQGLDCLYRLWHGQPRASAPRKPRRIRHPDRKGARCYLMTCLCDLYVQLVGQKWAALSRDEKQHYVQLAAQIRRGSSPGQVVPESLLPGDAKRAWTDMNEAHEHGTRARRNITKDICGACHTAV